MLDKLNLSYMIKGKFTNNGKYMTNHKLSRNIPIVVVVLVLRGTAARFL